MSRFHATYDFLWAALPKKFEIIGLELTGNSNWNNVFAKYFLTFLDYFLVAWRLASTKNNFIFVREYNNFSYLFFELFARLFKKRIYLNVNHNFKSEEAFNKKRAYLKPKSIFLVAPEYKGQSDSPKFFFPNCNVSPISIQKSVNEKKLKSRYKVGIIGAYRKEKNIEKLLDQICNFLQNEPDILNKFEFVLGSDLDCRSETNSKFIEFCDTESFDGYQHLLRGLDVAILNYDSSYRFRSSGVLYDLINNGIYCIVPNYLILSNQVHWPTKVGSCYSESIEIPCQLKEVLEYFQDPHYLENQIKYFAGRSLSVLKKNLEKYDE
jgi:hypothetical protein